MFLDHFRKGVEEQFERLSIVNDILLVVSMVSEFIDDCLDVFDDSLGIYRVGKKKFIMLAVVQMDVNVPLPQKSVEDGVRFDFYSVDGVVIHVEDIAREMLPIHVDDSTVGYEPNVIIPVKYRIPQTQIHADKVQFESVRRKCRSNSKRVLQVQKSRYGNGKKAPKKDVVDDQDRVAVANEKKLVPLFDVFREVKFVELVHASSIRSMGLSQ